MPKDYIERIGWAYASQHPIGSGPWKFVRHVLGESVQYEAVSSHWRASPAFKNMTIFVFPEEGTRNATLRTGVVDIAELSLDNVPGLETAGLRAAAVNHTGIAVQLYGTADPRATTPVNDVRVRRALAISLDRGELMNTYFRGKAGLAMPPYTTDSTLEIDVPYWRKYVAQMYGFDPKLAKQLLVDAGYPNGFNLTLWSFSASSSPWPPNVWLPSTVYYNTIAGYWGNIGVKASIASMDLGVWTLWRKGPADQLAGQAVIVPVTGDNSAARALELAFSSKAGDALPSGITPEMDRLVDGIYAEPDANKRREMIARALKVGLDTYAVFEIFSVPSMLGLGPRVDISAWSLPLAVPQFSAFAADIKRRQ